MPPSSCCSLTNISKYWEMMVTANKIPVRDPIAPRAPAITDKAPMHMPPNQAAEGIYLFNSWIIDESRKPRITMPCSFSCLLTSLADEPDTSIHVIEKNAQLPSMKTTYSTACIGSEITPFHDSGGER